MLRLVRALPAALVLLLCACTPDVEALLRWAQGEEEAARVAGLPCAELADDLEWRGLPLHFLYVIERESRCQPGAVNSASGDYGLTQIHASLWLPALCRAGIACTRLELLSAGRNLDAARYVFGVQGWAAWAATR